MPLSLSTDEQTQLKKAFENAKTSVCLHNTLSPEQIENVLNEIHRVQQKTVLCTHNYEVLYSIHRLLEQSSGRCKIQAVQIDDRQLQR